MTQTVNNKITNDLAAEAAKISPAAALLFHLVRYDGDRIYDDILIPAQEALYRRWLKDQERFGRVAGGVSDLLIDAEPYAAEAIKMAVRMAKKTGLVPPTAADIEAVTDLVCDFIVFDLLPEQIKFRLN